MDGTVQRRHHLRLGRALVVHGTARAESEVVALEAP